MREVGWICSPLKACTNYAQRLTEYFKYQFGHSPKIEIYDHHLCHAASSFYGSGFPEATVACFDFSGDSSSGLVAHARGNDFRVDAPFMVVTFPVTEKVAETMPEVVHVDNTARIQSVHADSNPLYSRLIGEFAKATSLPVHQRQPQHQRAAHGERCAGGAPHLFLLGAGRAVYLGPYRLSKSKGN